KRHAGKPGGTSAGAVADRSRRRAHARPPAARDGRLDRLPQRGPFRRFADAGNGARAVAHARGNGRADQLPARPADDADPARRSIEAVVQTPLSLPRVVAIVGPTASGKTAM